MSDMPRRFLLRGRAISAEELEEQKQAAERRAALVRQPGEGIHEYVRRVSAGTLQIIRTDELNSLNDRLTTALMELQSIQRQVRTVRSEPPQTAMQVAQQAIDRERTLGIRNPPPTTTIPVRLPFDEEERLIVGGPRHGVVMRFDVAQTHYVVRETRAVDPIEALQRGLTVQQTAMTTNHRYVRMAYTRIILMMYEPLINASRIAQDRETQHAMQLAGLR